MEPWTLPSVQQWCRLMAGSFARVIGRPLLDGTGPLDGPGLARRMYDDPAVLLSHAPGPDGDNVFCFANRQVQSLFGYPWGVFATLKSKLSAADDPATQDDRNRLLAEAMRKGFVDHYSGMRRDARGARFRISDAILWNVCDDEGLYRGQATIFKDWTPVQP